LGSEIEKPVEVLQNKIISNKVNKYYLIAGSFENKLNAERLVKELSAKGYASFIYFNLENQFTYACVSSFTNRSMAIQQSTALKEDGIAVWIYSVR
jgi:cell division septation protein DedD